jgi:hypothetical protein
VESYEYYECVEAPAGHNTMEESHVDSLALQFVEREGANVSKRNLEVQYLAALGINIVDCTLQADAERMELLPQLERMAQLRWNHLYDVQHHIKLTAAITREVKEQYNKYKNQSKQYKLFNLFLRLN